MWSSAGVALIPYPDQTGNLWQRHLCFLPPLFMHLAYHIQSGICWSNLTEQDLWHWSPLFALAFAAIWLPPVIPYHEHNMNVVWHCWLSLTEQDLLMISFLYSNIHFLHSKDCTWGVPIGYWGLSIREAPLRKLQLPNGHCQNGVRGGVGGYEPLPGWFGALMQWKLKFNGICSSRPGNKCPRVPVWVKGGGCNRYLGNARIDPATFWVGLP